VRVRVDVVRGTAIASREAGKSIQPLRAIALLMATIVSFAAKFNVGAGDGAAGLAALPPLATQADGCRRAPLSFITAGSGSLGMGRAFSLRSGDRCVSGVFSPRVRLRA
jgi:hypothetical protein